MSDIDRNSYQYRKWRRDVLFRDGYKCTRCGNDKNLEVHHILPIRLFPEKAFDLDNGVTLCKKCHYEEEGRTFTSKAEASCSGGSLIDNLHGFFKGLRTATYYISYRKNIVCNFWKALPMPRAFRKYLEKLGTEILFFGILIGLAILVHFILGL